MATDLAPFAGTIGGGFFYRFHNQVCCHHSWSIFCCISIFGISYHRKVYYFRSYS
jgi:hypothetical protein